LELHWCCFGRRQTFSRGEGAAEVAGAAAEAEAADLLPGAATGPAVVPGQAGEWPDAAQEDHTPIVPRRLASPVGAGLGRLSVVDLVSAEGVERTSVHVHRSFRQVVHALVEGVERTSVHVHRSFRQGVHVLVEGVERTSVHVHRSFRQGVIGSEVEVACRRCRLLALISVGERVSVAVQAFPPCPPSVQG
jgi:hypothetical protein